MLIARIRRLAQDLILEPILPSGTGATARKATHLTSEERSFRPGETRDQHRGNAARFVPSLRIAARNAATFDPRRRAGRLRRPVAPRSRPYRRQRIRGSL